MKLSLMNKKSNSCNILGTQLYCSYYSQILQVIDRQIQLKKHHFICVAATHLIMEAYYDHELRQKINQSLCTTTDGMPLVWLVRHRGYRQAQRVYGPDLMLKGCAMAQNKKYKIFLLGGTSGQGYRLSKNLNKIFPKLNIAGYHETPNRPLSSKDNQIIVKKINQSQADLVWIGLGCPFQESWMVKYYQQLDHALCIGVGAAFDFISGQKKQAPSWMRNHGLEWLFRLLQEPKRLWRRYLILNSKFIWALILQKWQKKSNFSI